jgi:hypothetical protein
MRLAAIGPGTLLGAVAGLVLVAFSAMPAQSWWDVFSLAVVFRFAAPAAGARRVDPRSDLGDGLAAPRPARSEGDPDEPGHRGRAAGRHGPSHRVRSRLTSTRGGYLLPSASGDAPGAKETLAWNAIMLSFTYVLADPVRSNRMVRPAPVRRAPRRGNMSGWLTPEVGTPDHHRRGRPTTVRCVKAEYPHRINEVRGVAQQFTSNPRCKASTRNDSFQVTAGDSR